MITLARYGSTSGKPVRLTEYEHHEAYLDKHLTRYEGTTAVVNALKLAAEVLTFSPPANFTTFVTIAREMRRLRGYGVTPRDLLLRVAAHYAHARRKPFSDPAFKAALSRAVLRLAPLDGYRPNSRLLYWLSDEITERLGMFANAFLNRYEADVDRERGVRRASTDFDTPAQSPEVSP